MKMTMKLMINPIFVFKTNIFSMVLKYTFFKTCVLLLYKPYTFDHNAILNQYVQFSSKTDLYNFHK